MADKAKSIMDSIAQIFTKSEASKRPKPISREYAAKNRQSIQDTFKSDPSADYNTKIRKAMGLE